MVIKTVAYNHHPFPPPHPSLTPFPSSPLPHSLPLLTPPSLPSPPHPSLTPFPSSPLPHSLPLLTPPSLPSPPHPSLTPFPSSPLPHSILFSPFLHSLSLLPFPFHLGASLAYGNAQFGLGTGPIYLSGLFCTGSEGSLLECSRYLSIGATGCHHSQDAGVHCSLGQCAHYHNKVTTI